MKIKFIELKKLWLGKYSGITLIPYVLYYIKGKTKKQIAELKNHELIHAAQVNDEIEKWQEKLKIKILGSIVGWISWYGGYIGSWFKNIFKGFFSIDGMSTRQAYINIPEEKEAYANDKNLDYLKNRPKFAVRKYR
jgi:hypothetical protein